MSDARDPVARAFMAAAMARLGVARARHLSDLLALEQRDAEVTVGRWVRGHSAPNFHHTMALLEKAGWLTPEAAAAYRAAVESAQSMNGSGP